LVTGAAGSNTFLAPVLPKADTLEAASEITVGVGAAQAIVAASRVGPDDTDLADRAGAGPAARVDTRVAAAAQLASALFGPIVVDVRTEFPEPGAVLVFVTGAIDLDTEARRRGRAANVALWAVEVVVAWHATIDTHSPFAGKARHAIVALGDAIAACRDPDTALPAGPDVHALIVGRVGTFSDART